jgi:hypothetical protein
MTGATGTGSPKMGCFIQNVEEKNFHEMLFLLCQTTSHHISDNCNFNTNAMFLDIITIPVYISKQRF